MLYFLLVIIAIGVLLASEPGRILLFFLTILVTIGVIIFIGFWVVVFVLNFLSNIITTDTASYSSIGQQEPPSQLSSWPGIIIGVVIAILIIYKAEKNSRKEKENKTEITHERKSSKEKQVKDSKKSELIGEEEMNLENDAQRIIQEVEERKKRAGVLDIDKIILSLFFWNGNSSFSTCKFSKASVISNFSLDKPTCNKCKFTLKEKEYIVSYTRENSTLEIYVEGKKVLGMKMGDSFEPTPNDPYISGIETWWCSDITAFIEGEWVKDLGNLIKQFEIEEDEEKRKKEEAPDRIQKLKEDFGI